MVVEAAFTSIGLNYFTKFVESRRIKNLKLAEANINKLRKILKNRRSWIRKSLGDQLRLSRSNH